MRTPRELVEERFIKPLDRPATDNVGIELEFPIVNCAWKAVDFDVVAQAMESFVSAFGFGGCECDAAGRIISAMDTVTGDTISFECSFNTVEWSFGKTCDINRVARRFHAYFEHLQGALAKGGHMLTGMGINPTYDLIERRPIENGRYRMLYRYLQMKATDGTHRHGFPEFGMFSAASQVQLDVDRDSVLDVIDTFNQLEPFKALLFANSWWAKFPDVLVNRDWLWEYSMHGVNRNNVGTWEKVPGTLDELVDCICAMSMFCTERDGSYLYFEPVPVREYFAGPVRRGYLADSDTSAAVEFEPDEGDIRYLRSYKNVDLTWRGTVEFRDVCAQPVCDTFSVAAFHAGLMHEVPALRSLLSSVPFVRSVTPRMSRMLFSQRPLPAFVTRRQLSELLLDILDLARRGLLARGKKEERFLQPLYLRAEQLSNPAQMVADRIQAGGDWMGLVREYGRLDPRVPSRFVDEMVNESGIGLEEESLRVCPDGRIAKTPHPFPDVPGIDRDFGEAQIEMVTSVHRSPRSLHDAILSMRTEVVDRLGRLASGPELLWPSSTPPYLGEDEEVSVARYDGDLAWKSRYRDYLLDKYGDRRMLFSGIHFNFSYPQAYLRRRFELSTETDYRRFVEDRYLQLAEKAAAYSWLIVACTAASPLQDDSYWAKGARGGTGAGGYSSLRMSEHGYWNDFIPVLDYSSIKGYADSIKRYVDAGQLRGERELYYPIRIKPRGAFSCEALSEGVSHIEFRMLDLNPLSRACIDERDIEFLLLLIAWMELQPRLDAGESQQRAFVFNVMDAARAPLEDVRLWDLDGTRVPLVDLARSVLADMRRLLGDQPAIRFQEEKIAHPERRYAEILRKRGARGFVESTLADLGPGKAVRRVSAGTASQPTEEGAVGMLDDDTGVMRVCASCSR